MDNMNYEKILQSFLTLNLSSVQSFFRQNKFLDKEVEAQYQIERYQRSMPKKFCSDAFLIFSFILMYVYIKVHDYSDLFANICLGLLAIGLILITSTYFKKDSRFDLLINHILVFSISIFLNTKVVYIACYKNTPFNDNESEIIRTIVYDFVGSNMLAYVALDSRISVSISLFLLNFLGVFVAQMKSKVNHYYYMDSLSSLPVTLFFYMFKKLWEASDRDIFAGKYRFEKFFHYARDFIQGTNGYYLNISKEFSIFCDSKMKTLLNEMQIDGKTGKFKNSDKLNEGTESINSNEINYLKSINYSTVNENYGNLSEEVLNLFTAYNEKNFTNEISKDKKEKLADKLEVMISGSFSTTNFIRVGKYKLQSLVSTKYFDVHFCKFNVNENTSVNDILMYDITELIESKRKIYVDSIIKERFLAKIVHEFKTPINSIIGVIGNIEDSLKSCSIQENLTTKMHLETIRNLSNYVIFLISDIIHFANIKSIEEIKLISQKIDLREIANFCFDILKSLLKSSHAKEIAVQPILEFDDEIDRLEMIADEIRLKQIILNFISNAVKFTKSGWIKLKCSIVADKEVAMVSIIDTGIGIKENEQQKLLNEFYMVNDETINNAMGSGLGLSISKSLANIMGMQISTKSTYGKGSEFSLTIPFKPDYHPKESLTNILTGSNLDQNKEMGNDKLSLTDLSYHTPDVKNEIRVQEFMRKPGEVKY